MPWQAVNCKNEGWQSQGEKRKLSFHYRICINHLLSEKLWHFIHSVEKIRTKPFFLLHHLVEMSSNLNLPEKSWHVLGYGELKSKSLIWHEDQLLRNSYAICLKHCAKFYNPYSPEVCSNSLSDAEESHKLLQVFNCFIWLFSSYLLLKNDFKLGNDSLQKLINYFPKCRKSQNYNQYKNVLRVVSRWG